MFSTGLPSTNFGPDVALHVLEGSREEIEAQLRMSIDAFFDFYPEI